MSNPNNAVGTSAGYNGRTTPNAFNDSVAAYTRGIISGWTCAPKSGMTVKIGGSTTERDVAIAEDNAGNKTTINNRSGNSIDVTITGAPSTGSRIDTIVAYVKNPQNGAGASDVDFPSITGLVVVKGTAATNPSPANETAIRSAITADGATGSTAYYVELAQILVGTNVTTIGSGVITQGAKATSTISADIEDNSIGSNKINWDTIPFIDGTFSTSGNITVGTARTNIATLSITTPGVYIINLGIDTNCLGAQLSNANIRIATTTTTLHERYFNNTGRDYFNGGISLTIVARISAATTITVSGSSGASSWEVSSGATRRTFNAVKVA